MNPFPRLNWIERWAAWILHRSPRVSLLAIKHRDVDIINWSYLFTDDVAIQAIKHFQKFELQGFEPPDMMLERLYHSPSFGEE